MKNIHVKPTDKLFNENSIVLNTKSNLWILGKNIKNIVRNRENAHLLTQNIYITSDEQGFKGDWVIHTPTNKVIKVEEKIRRADFKKIILTTDPDLIADGLQAMPDEFFEWFINNPSCEFVEVEELCGGCGSNDGDCWRSKECNKGYFKNKYKIIIPKEEHKQSITKATKQQTAVEWLYETLWKQTDFSLPSSIFDQAKAMEKKQIKTAWLNSLTKGDYNSAEQYYTETYGS